MQLQSPLFSPKRPHGGCECASPAEITTAMPDFWGFTTADLIDLELGDVPKQMLASLVNILAKKVVKVEEDFALLDIEYTQTCEELDDLQIEYEADSTDDDDDENAEETDAVVIPKEMAQHLIEAQCTQSPAKRLKMMKHLPNMLAFDPNALSRFPDHLRKDWARKEQGELATWLLKTENVGTFNEISMAIAKKIKNSLVVRAVLTGDRADRRAMAAWRRRVVIMIPSNMIDVLARVLVLAGFALVHRSARGKVTLESTSCTDLESWIGIEVRLAVVTSAVTDVARELTFLFSSHARARALSTGQPDARRLAATHEDAELPDEPHGRARASPREGA